MKKNNNIYKESMINKMEERKTKMDTKNLICVIIIITGILSLTGIITFGIYKYHQLKRWRKKCRKYK